MKHLSFLLGMLLIAPAHALEADDQNSMQFCQEQASFENIQDPMEVDAYVRDCMESMRTAIEDELTIEQPRE